MRTSSKIMSSGFIYIFSACKLEAKDDNRQSTLSFLFAINGSTNSFTVYTKNNPSLSLVIYNQSVLFLNI